ncbi:MAG: phosphoribosyltransferase family protein [Perlucidibaca sp.]
MSGRHVLLIDDVLTTGATLRALCPCLQAAGATRIDVMVIARTLPP